jgi:hypothetical protein
MPQRNILKLQIPAFTQHRCNPVEQGVDECLHAFEREASATGVARGAVPAAAPPLSAQPPGAPHGSGKTMAPPESSRAGPRRAAGGHDLSAAVFSWVHVPTGLPAASPGAVFRVDTTGRSSHHSLWRPQGGSDPARAQLGDCPGSAGGGADAPGGVSPRLLVPLSPTRSSRTGQPTGDRTRPGVTEAVYNLGINAHMLGRWKRQAE